MTAGPFHFPASSTHETWTAPLSTTLKRSVWFATPNCCEAARCPPTEAAPVELMARGPFHLPAPWTQVTRSAPLVSTTNTSVWLATPNCGEVARCAPAGARFGDEMASGPFQLPAPCTHETCSAPLVATLNTSVWLETPSCGET